MFLFINESWKKRITGYKSITQKDHVTMKTGVMADENSALYQRYKLY